ncbi:FkbM family methyltransferase [Sulfitobacter sp. S190]|uniref:FkbM family methyltransferase n=1 Tax=Sulfitobacter sp. S190 TaxID=2867022 RepID=UPI0021A29AAE|nr:FkbM family methyltransferase [Sulfitobacter sp. S190]UWR23737.1 FkbM family methyltransferase [Sulfitobacter sp. S190]
MEPATTDAPAARTRSPFVRSRGLKFPKDGRFIRGQIRGALRENRYESKESEAVLKVVRDGDTVMELGAGIGYMSTFLATRRKLKAIHAFEANPHLIPYIKSVHEANNLTNAHVHNAILGKRKGTRDFYVRRKLLGSSLDPRPSDNEKTLLEVTKVDVLNARATFKELQIDTLVCDIEGAEAELLPLLDLSNLRAAVIETHPQLVGPEGINAVFRAFMDAGMAYYHRGSNRKVVSFRRQW